MLRRLEWIKDCGIFADYRWDAGLQELARINVIYGPNGSGKTSLARALDGLCFVEDGARRISALVEDSVGRRSTAGKHDPVFDRIFVFSEDYVDRNHRFAQGNADMEAVLTLGQRTAEAEERLAELKGLIDTGTTEHDSVLSDLNSVKRQLDSAYDQIAEQVVTDLRRAGGRYQSRGSYSVMAVKNAFASTRDGWGTLSDEDLARNKTLVSSDNREPLPDIQFGLSVADDLPNRVSKALATTPVTIVLDTLRSHPEASAWVQEGHAYHNGLDTCIFCGSPLSPERKADIEQHFSKDVANLQHELKALIGEVDRLEEQLGQKLNGVSPKGLLFEDLRERHDDAVTALQKESDALREWLRESKKLLERKLSNVLADVGSASVSAAPQVDGSQLEKVRGEHNQRVEKHASLVKEAAEKVELHHLKAAEKRIDDLSASSGTSQDKAEKIKRKLDQYREEVASLENVEGNPTPSAQVLTQEVSRLLGRDELKFETVDKKYWVTRDGAPAVGLSAGERTAITLIHFLESVARFDQSRGKAIVVIDDPVSSLDSNIFLGVSTYIWSETLVKDHVDQVILLTHNFELFRQWDIQLEGLHKRADLKKKYPAEFYELKAVHAKTKSGDRVRRRPVLVSWPPTPKVRKKARSSYHHAFIAIANARLQLSEDDSLEHRLDAQLLFPNVIRRMLETFLAFKRPESAGDFTNAMRESAALLVASGYTGDANALRLRLTRYAHAYSHSETPETVEAVNPDEVAPAITAVFIFMNQLDQAHFRGLCEVVEVKPEDLLFEPVSED